MLSAGAAYARVAGLLAVFWGIDFAAALTDHVLGVGSTWREGWSSAASIAAARDVAIRSGQAAPRSARRIRRCHVAAPARSSNPWPSP
jgi:hypothetical protein